MIDGCKKNPENSSTAKVNQILNGFKRTDLGINDATITPCCKGYCYCEKNMFNSKENSAWKTCKLNFENTRKCKF